MSNREIEFQADLVLNELFNIQKDFEIEDKDMIPILQTIMKRVEYCHTLTEQETHLIPVNSSLESKTRN